MKYFMVLIYEPTLSLQFNDIYKDLWIKSKDMSKVVPIVYKTCEFG